MHCVAPQIWVGLAGVSLLISNTISLIETRFCADVNIINSFSTFLLEIEKLIWQYSTLIRQKLSNKKACQDILTGFK